MKALEFLKAAGAEALKQLADLSFKVSDVKAQPFQNGNVGFKAKLSDGRIVTFFQKTMDEVIEPVDDETLRVKPGMQLQWSERDQAYWIQDPSKRKSIWTI